MNEDGVMNAGDFTCHIHSREGTVLHRAFGGDVFLSMPVGDVGSATESNMKRDMPPGVTLNHQAYLSPMLRWNHGRNRSGNWRIVTPATYLGEVPVLSWQKIGIVSVHSGCDYGSAPQS